jgi:hypothetical protein
MKMITYNSQINLIPLQSITDNTNIFNARFEWLENTSQYGQANADFTNMTPSPRSIRALWHTIWTITANKMQGAWTDLMACSRFKIAQ